MPSAREEPRRAAAEPAPDFDAVVVGAGFSGIYMLHRLRGLGFSVRLVEAGAGLGGTWYWNRYPGARVDVQSMTYSYSFSDELQQEWRWSERYAGQPELLRYMEHVADRFDLRRDMQFETRVTGAAFDEATGRWEIRTDRGGRLSARFCIMATGCLSVPSIPRLEGLDSFEGDWYHTGSWPHEGVDFTGKRVGVVGTGSSGIQVIPLIAEQAAHLTVFQRTPSFSVPAWNGPVDPEADRAVKANYAELRRKARDTIIGDTWESCGKRAFEVSPAERRREYETRWRLGGFAFSAAFDDLLTDAEANETAAEFVRERIRATVRDPAVAELLCPRDHPLGAKRMCIDTGYYATYNRENVALADLRRSPLVEVTPRGLRTADAEFELDAIVFATGFDAMTGALLAIDIRGRGGRTLAEKWSAGPRAYLGVATAGFPNLFLITGPGSPSVISNMMVSIEQHVDWIAGCLAYLRERGLARIEPAAEAEDAWLDHVDEVAAGTLYPLASSWYIGANIPGKARVFMPYVGGVKRYRQVCDEVAAKGYEGFVLGA